MFNTELVQPAPVHRTVASAPRRTVRQRVAFVIQLLHIRLRFIAVFAIAFLVIGKWDVVTNYWGLVIGGGGANLVAQPVSVETEFFCPMDPGVLSDWPGKCGVCSMALVKRKKGDVVPLPEGVVARMQLSPYRVQLAGIQTSPVAYQPLVREIVTIGRVQHVNHAASGAGAASAAVEAEVFERDLVFITSGQRAEVCGYGGIIPACVGTVGPIDHPRAAGSHVLSVPIDIDNPPRGLRPAMTVTVRIQVPVAAIEPFCSMPRNPPPLAPDSVRAVFGCAEHGEVLGTEPGNCPLGKNELERRPLAKNQRVAWWCPMHPEVASDAPGAQCRKCNGMKLLPRVVTFVPVGSVLAVPETAVIDTGTRKVVYVERSPGMFDGIEVTLGPRCGDAFPVIRGLEAGQRVATRGAFLIDAETRLNPSIAASYFGATTAAAGSAQATVPAAGAPGNVPAPPHREVRDLTEYAAVLAQLGQADAERAASQKVCPVSGEPLGSMGVPQRVTVNGITIFLCCKGCEPELRANQEKFLPKFEQSKP